MLSLYETVFGARVQYQNPGLAFLTYDDEHHRFAFANMAVFQPEGAETQRRGAGVGLSAAPGSRTGLTAAWEITAILSSS